MTVRELREKLEGLDDGMEVVAVGYFGEAIRLHAGDFRVSKGPNQLVEYGWQRNAPMIPDDVFVVPVADVGPEPD